MNVVAVHLNVQTQWRRVYVVITVLEIESCISEFCKKNGTLENCIEAICM